MGKNDFTNEETRDELDFFFLRDDEGMDARHAVIVACALFDAICDKGSEPVPTGISYEKEKGQYTVEMIVPLISHYTWYVTIDECSGTMIGVFAVRNDK